MASRSKPRRYAASRGKAIRLSTVKKMARLSSGGSKPLLRFLTIVWVQSNGVPFDTSDGFVAVLSSKGRVVARAEFDDFGVAQFNNIQTPTNVNYQLRIVDLRGQTFRVRTLPAGIEAFAVIG